MADNVTVGGVNYSTDDVTTLNGGTVAAGSSQTQRIKLQYGDDSIARDVSDSFPLPVNISASGGNSTAITQTLTAAGASSLAGTASTTGSAVLNVSAAGNASFHLLSAAFVGTVVFEQSFDPAGTNGTWAPVPCVPEDALNAPMSTLTISTATAYVRQFTQGMFGPALFRVRCSAFTSGSLTVYAKAGPGWYEGQPALAPSNSLIGSVNVAPAPLTTGTASGNVFAARSATVGTTSAVLQAAPAAGLSLYITDVSVGNSGATLSVVSLLPTAGTAFIDIPAAASGGGGSMNFQTPVKLAAATGLSVIASAASTTLYATATGYIAP